MSAIKISEEINKNRRRFLGTAAMTMSDLPKPTLDIVRSSVSLLPNDWH